MRYPCKCFVIPNQDWQNQQAKMILKRSIRQQYSSLPPELLLGKICPNAPSLFKAKHWKKSSIFSSDCEVNIRFKQKLWTWLQELTDKSNKAQGHSNDIDVLKSTESFNFRQVHQLAQGRQVTFTVLVLVVLNSSDEDFTVSQAWPLLHSSSGTAKPRLPQQSPYTE